MWAELRVAEKKRKLVELVAPVWQRTAPLLLKGIACGIRSIAGSEAGEDLELRELQIRRISRFDNSLCLWLYMTKQRTSTKESKRFSSPLPNRIRSRRIHTSKPAKENSVKRLLRGECYSNLRHRIAEAGIALRTRTLLETGLSLKAKRIRETVERWELASQSLSPS